MPPCFFLRKCWCAVSKIGEERQWDQVIFPGMKEAIVGVLLVSQDIVEDRKVRGGRERKRELSYIPSTHPSMYTHGYSTRKQSILEHI